MFSLEMNAANGQNFVVDTFYNLEVATEVKKHLKDSGLVVIDLPCRTKDCARFYIAYVVFDDIFKVSEPPEKISENWENVNSSMPHIVIPDIEPSLIVEEESHSSHV